MTGQIIGSDEVARLKNNLARVFAVLLDGAWHSGAELAEVGGSAWDSRIRDLRTERCGSQIVKSRRTSGALREYKLDTETLTDEWRTRILTGDLGKPVEVHVHRCPRCNGAGKIRLDTPCTLLAGLMQLVDAAAQAGVPIPQAVLDLEAHLNGETP